MRLNFLRGRQHLSAGGPAAHIAVFQKLFVENLKWMSMTVFTELLALGQCLPGPTSTQVIQPPTHYTHLSAISSPSTRYQVLPRPRPFSSLNTPPPHPTSTRLIPLVPSPRAAPTVSPVQMSFAIDATKQCTHPLPVQMSFAIGVTKKGIPGGLLSGILFQYPGLIMMTILGAGAAEYLVDPADWVRAMAQGFGATGVALVAGAAVSLLTKLCKTRTLQLLAAFSALMAFYHPAAWMFPSLIAVGGIVVLVQTWKEPLKKSDYEEHVENLGLNIWGGLVLILVWIGLLVGFIAARDQTDYSDDANKPIHWVRYERPVAQEGPFFAERSIEVILQRVG